MKKTLTLGTLTFSLLAASTATAGIFGTNITIQDKNTGSGWYGSQEDNETEPGTLQGQAWDLEGMFLDGTKLTLVGGYDFKNGYGGTTSGDIFIDLNGDARYGTANSNSLRNTTTKDLSGYDLVLDLNFTTMKFDVIELINGVSSVRTATDIGWSNPWRYVSDGRTLYSGLGFDYFAGLSDANAGATGGTHYAISLDVSFLSGKDAIFHNTMSCGNDNLMGSAHVPDAAATISLLGVSLLGLAGARRWMVKA